MGLVPVTRTYPAYRDAAKIFEWFESHFAPFSYDQLVKLEAGLQGEQKAVYGMLLRAKDWRMKWEDPDVLKACEIEDEEYDQPPACV